ncbi:Nodule Cysteine-Rich (NCR) secreted peptide [Medicago truncatula]|uniref:Nodule Cysteine-Rich (NCR) secreted peptide n=1 Tax=Medicago truncatula TaxID=3880 RepID=A0A072UBS9_MEDTR|nr:Nodule Cysteine-Rich (NCR) secreted peptide [Medicago truncatula]
MAQFLIFVYTLIIFISLFLVEAPCVTVADCPPVKKPLKMWCIRQTCFYGFGKRPDL